tara:strand:- start:2358 stop:2789 length:432 start_codon:yes stop_codon:yes gene_type:complete
MYITFFGIGYIPIASGTFGSMAGIILGYIIYLIEFNLFYILIPILFILGIISSNIYEKQTNIRDSSIIVIDEVVGQLISMMFFMHNNFLVILSFFIFRFFDILKPWPASYIDNKIKGGMGVMLDDVIAGIYTIFTIYIIKLFL